MKIPPSTETSTEKVEVNHPKFRYCLFSHGFIYENFDSIKRLTWSSTKELEQKILSLGYYQELNDPDNYDSDWKLVY